MSYYCKICGCCKSNESFSGRGHAQHICKKCAKLPKEVREEKATLSRIYELPFNLSKVQRTWLEKLKADPREAIRSTAESEWNIRFVPRAGFLHESEDDSEWDDNPEYSWLLDEGIAPDENWFPDPDEDYELPF